MAKKTATEKADKADKTEKGSTSGDKGAGDKTPVENAKESEEQPVELGKLSSPLAVACVKCHCLVRLVFATRVLAQQKLLLSRNFYGFNSSEDLFLFVGKQISRSVRQSFNEMKF